MGAIKDRVILRLDPIREYDEPEILSIIDDCISDVSKTRAISANQKLNIRSMLFNDLKRFDILQELVEDDSITEIMINGWDTVFYEKNGEIRKWEKHFDNPKRLSDIVQRIAAASNKIVNEAVPIADTRLYDGSRVNIVMNPVAINGPIVTIRKFYNKPLSMEKMIEINSISIDAAQFLEKLVVAKYNIFISGGTGSGKTTFLNALSNYIPNTERVITIEDSAELKLMNIDNLVKLEARSANIEGKNAITIRDLIRSALRMRPDRIIVGEVRGGEAMDMLQAMQTGHDGSLSTGHANNPEDMMIRLETMVLMGMDMPVTAIRRQIASAIDVIVHLGRLRDRSRRVLSISEVVGFKDDEIILNDIYSFEEESVDEKGKIVGGLKPTGHFFRSTQKLEMAGIHCKECG